MPQAIDTPTTPGGRRRALMAGTAALVTAGAGAALAAAHEPDADLLAAAEELRAADAAITVHLMGEPPRDAPRAVHQAHDDLTAALDDRWSDAIEAVTALEPSTLPGLAAKAQATIVALNRNVPVEIGATVEDAGDDHDLLAYRLAHDVLALTGAEPWPEHPATAEFAARAAARAAEPRPPTDWQMKAEAERARLAALGLNRPDGAGLTCGDEQLVGWLCRRVEVAMGRDVAERVRDLSSIPADHFDATWHTALDRIYADRAASGDLARGAAPRA